MMRLNTDKGVVTINSDVITNIAGMAATNCFGVKGMAARSRSDGLFHLLRQENMSKGVLVTYHDDDTITIDLHVMMDHGINIAAVGPSIINRVNYDVTKATGLTVKEVNVYIDSISVD